MHIVSLKVQSKMLCGIYPKVEYCIFGLQKPFPNSSKLVCHAVWLWLMYVPMYEEQFDSRCL